MDFLHFLFLKAYLYWGYLYQCNQKLIQLPEYKILTNRYCAMQLLWLKSRCTLLQGTHSEKMHGFATLGELRQYKYLAGLCTQRCLHTWAAYHTDDPCPLKALDVTKLLRLNTALGNKLTIPFEVMRGTCVGRIWPLCVSISVVYGMK